MTPGDVWTLAVAGLVALLCSWVGVWLVLQRLSMVGDAISHAVLPGLVGAFALFGARSGPLVAAGALVAGLVTVFLTRGLTRSVGVRSDAALGLVFTLMFAAGVLLVNRYAAQVDLDPGCVLYGLLEFVALDSFPVFGVEAPRVLQTIVPVLGLVGGFLLLFRREIALAAFDSAHAAAMGRRPALIDFGLMASVALTAVASFEAVGSVLVVALLVAPASTALLMTRRLRSAFGWASAFALSGVIIGYSLAVRWNTSAAGMIAVALGAQYGVVAIARLVARTGFEPATSALKGRHPNR